MIALATFLRLPLRTARPVRHSYQTKPVVDYYSKQGLYTPINANQSSETVKAIVAACLAK